MPDDDEVCSGAGPSACYPLVSLERWREGKGVVAGIAGVVLRADEDIAQIEADLARIPVVAFEFDSVTEGRCYSRARLLRERYGFTGEIRAVGNVSPDRLAFMERCGFNAFDLGDEFDTSAALAAFTELSDVYQPCADGEPTIAQRRGLRRD